MKRVLLFIGISLYFSSSVASNVGLPTQSTKHAKSYTIPRGNPMEEEASCLAVAMFREANTETFRGKMLVASVIVNRMKKRHMTACQVIREKGQFSWVRGKASLTLNKDSKLLLPTAHQVVYDVKHGRFVSYAKDATYFHSRAVKPKWRKKMILVAEEGSHRFYAERRKL